MWRFAAVDKNLTHFQHFMCRKIVMCIGELEKWNSKARWGPRFLVFLHHFVSVCRMITRVGALESPDVGGHCRYLEHVYRTPRKVFRGVWSQKLHFFLRSMKNGPKSKTSQIGKNRCPICCNMRSLIASTSDKEEGVLWRSFVLS